MLQIYNTLTKKKEFFPQEQKINIYVCGPTVYNDIHIGNARVLIFFDIVKKYLSFLKYKICWVVNITDIDDKIINKAALMNITEKELTTKYTEAFFKIIKKLNINIDFFPKATDYIKQMIELIQFALDKKLAYFQKSGIYFDIIKNKQYGILNQQNFSFLYEDIKKKEKNNKKNGRDFALWKFTNQGLVFDSPWGKGRPGWHTECVTMNQAFFKEKVTIHGGGKDLIFPHHENEIIQHKMKYQNNLALFWMHSGYVNIDNKKMSKSSNNFLTVKQFLQKKSANVLRLMFLSKHYRQDFNYNSEIIDIFSKKMEKILILFKKIRFFQKINQISKEKTLIQEYIFKFKNYMNDDFNTDKIIVLIEEIIKQINKNKEKIAFFNTLNLILKILGFKINIKILSKEIQQYFLWLKLKKEKKFKAADKIRLFLFQKNIL